MKFASFLRGRDSFGHTVKLVYRGSETYNSVIGGIMTLLVKALTLVLIIQAFEELFFMKDPLITNYHKPLTLEDRQELYPMKFDDYDYVLAFKVSITDIYG